MEKKANDKKNVTEVVFILDRSGSMEGREADTIGGFNSTLAKQKKEKGEVLWTTVLFDDQYEVIHDRLPIKEVKAIGENEYYVRGCTALLDAVGRTIDHIKTVHYIDDIDNGGHPAKTLFIITTDGMENASHRFTYRRVKELISEQTERGWEFLFLGANIDAADVGSRMGIRPEMSATFINDGAGIGMNFETINKVMGSYRKSGKIDVDALETVREDYRKRKGQ